MTERRSFVPGQIVSNRQWNNTPSLEYETPVCKRICANYVRSTQCNDGDCQKEKITENEFHTREGYGRFRLLELEHCFLDLINIISFKDTYYRALYL